MARPKKLFDEAHKSDQLVKQCHDINCGNRKTSTCLAIIVPAKMWEDGKSCWAKNCDPLWPENIARAVEQYRMFLSGRTVRHSIVIDQKELQ